MNYLGLFIGTATLIFLIRKWRVSASKAEAEATRCEDAKLHFHSAMHLLRGLNTRNKIPPEHGMDHACKVVEHAIMAILATHYKLSNNKVLAIYLAALLHDADDRKYYPNNKNFENARDIVRTSCDNYKVIEHLVVQMIGYVSASANGDRVPAEAKWQPWLLYPRWADRLEAGGWIGVVRAWKYTLETSRPLFTPDTPRARTEDELWKIATKERYAAYSGRSASMIDHFYDKLLHICNFETENDYFRMMAEHRRAPLIFICLEFGRTGELGDHLLELAQKNHEAGLDDL